MKNILSKVKEMIKKHDNICIFLGLEIILNIYLLTTTFFLSDEVWLFSFVYKFTNGYKLYSDINIITTPLFHFVGKLVFLIFGNNYTSIRIYGALIYGVMFTIIYILFKKIKINKMYSFTYTIFIFLIFTLKRYFYIGASYNFLALVFVMIAIILEINNKKNNINTIFKGLVLFCMFMTKQNVVVLYGISLLIIYLIKLKNKETSIKEVLKDVLLMAIAFIVPLIMFVIYLKTNNSFEDFISYCFLGMKEFGTKNISVQINMLPLSIIYIVGVAASFIIIRKKEISIEVKRINYIIMPFSIIMIFWAYPIYDEYHTLVGILISTILLIYNLHYFIVNEAENKSKLERKMKIFALIIIVYVAVNTLAKVCLYEISNDINYELKPYIGMIMEPELKERMDKVSNYIKENEEKNIDTKIVTADAVIYMNVLNKNNKNYDLPLTGNLGKDGEEGLISEIRNLKKGTRILIKKKKMSWQESDKIKNVIINEFTKIDEIEDFDIYEK